LDYKNYTPQITKYNTWSGEEIELLAGEHYCPRCKGRGMIRIKRGRGPQLWRLNWKKCPTCNGKGKIDWISKIMLR